MPSAPERRRAVRSFVRREGRLTPGQRRALDAHYNRFGVADGDAPIDFDALFGRRAVRVVEIGFGNGASLAAQALAAPGHDFLGIEVHRPGVGQLLARLADGGIDNVRVLCDDAVRTLEQRIADASLDRVQVFFPDPWPKKRHHKRRLIQPAFVALLSAKLRPGGRLHLATDWQPYAGHMLEVLAAAPALGKVFDGYAGPDGGGPEPAARPPTRFERRGLRLGHGVRDLIFERVDGAPGDNAESADES